MKKSVIFRLAQHAVLQSCHLPDSDKLEVLRELIVQEDLALFVEKKEEQEKAE